MTIDPTVGAQALAGLFASAGIVFFWLGPLQWTATDHARNEMFAARDELFDEALAGRVSFDDQNYRIIRAAINANIRYAHVGSLVRLVMYVLRMGIPPRTPSHSRLAASAITDPEARRVALRVVTRMEGLAANLLFQKSPLLGILLLLLNRGDWRKIYSRAVQDEAVGSGGLAVS
jgi:hypothetical protein